MLTFQSPFVAVIHSIVSQHLGAHFCRCENELVDRDLYRLRPRRNGKAQYYGGDKGDPFRRHGGVPAYFRSAATCSACCSWPWNIFRPVCNRPLSSPLLAEGISVLSSAPFTVLW